MSISKEDMRKLQVMQNKCLRMLTHMDRYTPTTALLKKANMLSVHQIVAHQSATQVFNVLRNQAPTYHFQRLFPHINQTENRNIRSVANMNTRVEFSGSLGRSSFFHSSSKLWCALPASIKTASTLQTFKTRCRKWTMENISIKP